LPMTILAARFGSIATTFFGGGDAEESAIECRAEGDTAGCD